MMLKISDDRFKKQRRADALGKPKKVQINVLVEPLRRQAIDEYTKAITAQLVPLRGDRFTVNPSNLFNDYLDRDPHFRAIERKLNKEQQHGGRNNGQDIDIGQ